MAFFVASGKEYEIIRYLEQVPNRDELATILIKLGLKPIDLVRTKEKIWVDNYKNRTMTNADVVQAMIDNPILIERPIVVNGDKAVVARPLEKVLPII